MAASDKTILTCESKAARNNWSLIALAKKTRRKRTFRRGHPPYLTKIRFYWCDTCNVPRIALTECSTCGTMSREVPLSPPGDPYPAMDGHIRSARRTLDAQFGEGIGSHLLPADKTIVMNKVSSLDAMYEFIVDGQMVGRYRFDIPIKDYRFLLSLEGGRRVGSIARQKWVSCHEGVLKFLKEGANLLVPGVVGCDSGIELDDDVWIIDPDGSVIGVGTAKMTGPEMAKSEKGHAVKIREVADPSKSNVNEKSATWDHVVASNSADIERIEREAMEFIRRTIEKVDAPVVVGFSGGKDSLATYLVVEKATGMSPPMFFLDTGLELPETLQHINEFAEQHNAKIITQAANEQFWESVDVFGPPARDFRWCCKVLKLGPAATSISEHLGGRSLSFMGQRKLESFQRSIEPRVTSNPWVPGQTSANPIQNWNALEVWLYIFREKASFNPLYNQGYHRMGCYLCPSSPLAEFHSLSETHPDLYRRWEDKLSEWAEKLRYPSEWVSHGFWRWKKLPPGQMKLVEELQLEIEMERQSPSEAMKLDIVKGVSPCTSSGFSLEGQFSKGIDLDRVSEVMRIFGPTKYSEELGALRTIAGKNAIMMFNSGSLVIRGEDERQIEQLSRKIERAVTRALFCQGCGTCIPQCEQEALHLRDGVTSVDERKCTHCLKCDSWPCPTYLT
ncbi:MAG: phosphoadenosine phosphosulfate reductase family protein [Candidatus Thorarchaeota archaeon]